MHRALPILALLAACTPDDPENGVPFAIAPERGPMSGYFDVRVETALAPTEVRIGGIRGFDLRHEDGAVVFTVQGHPGAGPTDVELIGPGGDSVHSDAFTWEPGTAGFETFVAMGASLSQGVQGGVPTHHGQRHSPSRFVAEMSGAYHPIPLHIEGLFPAIRGEHIGPPPDCKDPGVVDHLTNAAIDVLAKINDVENNRIGFYLGRVDPDLAPYNVATGNSGVPTMIYGPDPNDFAEGFLARFVFDPYLDIADDIVGSQLGIVEDLQPTVIMCSDTYGNDLLNWTPIEEIEPEMEVLVDALAATEAQVFLANIPRLTHLPGANSNPERDALAIAYRDALDRAAARADNVHVVDFFTAVEETVDLGIALSDRTLKMEAYGGIISTDGLHLSDVGYAWEANLFIAKMNEVMGTDMPLVDLDEVYPTDEHRPEALLEQGIDPACIP